MKGRVTKSTGKWYKVLTENGETIHCALKGKLRQQGIRSTNPVAVGDIVHVEMDNEVGVIREIEERKNHLIRKATNLSHQSHVLAANIDQAMLIATITRPKTIIEFIDRFLVSAEAFQVPAIIVFNKTDLYNEQEMGQMHYLMNIYRHIGYNCLSTSVETGENIKEFGEMLAGKTTVLSGNSGVGKSSLINQIEPDLNLKTAHISKQHQSGKHITTFAEMFPLSNGGFIIDTPGIRGFGLVHIEKEELYHFFPEIFKKAEGCKYHNCSHTNEPDCAVTQAVEAEEIAKSRYRSYLNMYYDGQGRYRENPY